MTSRFWLYSALVIVIIGSISFWVVAKNNLNHRATIAGETLIKNDQATLTLFLAKQTDAAKLIGLAKRVNNSEPALVQPIVERAYALGSTNPDAVWLASYYHPELKTKALQLNPLADQTINPAAPLGQLK